MKTNFKIIPLLAIFFSIVLTGCDKDEQRPDVQALCNADGGTAIEDQLGRVYKRSNSGQHFFYIGNPQIPNSGGYIPCSGLPKEFQQEDLLVIYSGIYKGTLPDIGDPLFGYITITKIKKSE